MTTHPRSAWNAQPARAVFAPLHDVPYGAAHDIGGGPTWPTNIAATLAGIQADLFARGYFDTAYCYGVDQHGDQWVMRGDVHDAATLGYAGQSFSVLAICNAAAPGFVMPSAMLAGIEQCFRDAQARGVLNRQCFIEGHHWYDMHVTTSPTVCCSAVENSMPQIKAAVAQPDPPIPTPPASKGVLLTTVATHQSPTSPGRMTYAFPVPAFECVVLRNGATVHGDRPSGTERTYIPAGLPPGSHLQDIFATGDPSMPFAARYLFANGDEGTYAPTVA